MSTIKPKYSGRYSIKFWSRLNSLTGKDWDTAYDMGVDLQNLEEKLLKFLDSKIPDTGGTP